MSLGPAITVLKARVAAGFTAWPLRWPNETFEGIATDADGNPIGDDMRKIPFVMAEVIGYKNRLRSFGVPGSRTTIHPGVLRFYLLVPSGQGTDDAYVQSEALGALVEQQAFPVSASSQVRTYAPSTNADVASVEDGSYWVLQMSTELEFTYIS